MFTYLARTMACRSFISRSQLKFIKPNVSTSAFAYSKRTSDARQPSMYTDSTQPQVISTQRPSFRLRRQKLPPYPEIEAIPELELDTFLRTNFKTVKYGEYEFKESLDGFVHVYITAHEISENYKSHCGYSVVYHKDHPSNMTGLVEGRQALNHRNLFGFLKALESIPANSFKKVCFCVTELTLIKFIARVLCTMSENSFRSVRTGKLNKDLETCMAVNTLIRTRTDLKIRMKFVPPDLGVTEIFFASRRAERAARQAFVSSLEIKDYDE